MDSKKKARLDKYDRVQLGVSYVLKLLIAAAIGFGLWKHDYFLMWSSLIVLIFTFLPAVIERNYKFNLPIEVDLIITTFLYFHFFLGEVTQFYKVFWWWDLLLHLSAGILLGLLGFLIVFFLFHTHKIKANAYFAILFTVSLALALSAIWEIFEFSMDSLFAFNMQKSGLVDTMWDLIASLVGAIAISIAGYFYLKKPHAGVIDRLIRRINILNE